jgi:membrane-bound lytic murein transglycosylase D
MLAEEAGIDGELLRWANQELLYYITPPGSGYYLKLRSADRDKVAEVLNRRDAHLVRYYVHTIRSGDTLLALARHYGISVEQLLESNPGTDPRFLRIGSHLMIPALRETTPFTGSIPSERPDFSGTHVVRRGETLWSIAMAWGIAPEVLAEANGMSLNDILREGRTIKTPIRE